MKKFSLLLTVAALMVSSSVFAGSIDYLSNQSAKFILNNARTGATDGADIVAYNPAGTALMNEGLFIDLSSQTLLKYYSQDVTTSTDDFTFEQGEPTYAVPNLYAVYNFGKLGIGNLAIYMQAGVTAGGGSLEWDKGTAALVSSFGILGATDFDIKVKPSSVYYDFGGGAAYSFLDDMISISAGAKYVMAKRGAALDGDVITSTYTITIDSEYEYEAAGITPVIGLDVRPVKELTIGLRYEMETNLEFDFTQKKNDVETSTNNAIIEGLVAGLLSKDGQKYNINLPQIISAGVEYMVIPELAVSLGGNIYMLGSADMNGYEDFFGTGWEATLGAVYKVIDPLKVGGCFTYTVQGAKDELLETTESEVFKTVSANPVLDSITFALGAIYQINEMFEVTFAANWVHYLSADVTTDNNIDISYNKDVYTIALGVGFKM